MKTIVIAAIFAASLASVSATPAPAQAGDERRIAVRHADLDLGTAAGRAALDLRLLHAARTACGIPSPADPRGQMKADACLADARAAASRQRDAVIALAMRQPAPAPAGGLGRSER